MSETTTPKKWQKIKIFDTYEEAFKLKEELSKQDDNSDLLIKIRRCGPEGTKFKVKTWRPIPSTKNKKEQQ
jgi:hypothetical protein